ncbi:ribosomal protein L17 [Xylariaceae sp. FL0255]|nr:ribosomal protein L17 [Xylariaceae sp. FL0255]
MAGGLVKYRHLSRNSAHRQALLRNLVTSLVKHEAIHTSYAKAKEAQRLAEKLITLAKRNNETSRRSVTGILYTPHLLIDKVFGELRQRYVDRPGGYTRVLRTEPKSAYDQGESAILQFVDGPRDMRFAMTAAAVARDKAMGYEHNEMTLKNRAKVLRYRGKNGEAQFEEMVRRAGALNLMEKSGKDSFLKPGYTPLEATTREEQQSLDA